VSLYDEDKPLAAEKENWVKISINDPPDTAPDRSTAEASVPGGQTGGNLPRLSRRRFLAKMAGAGALTALGSGAYAWRIEPVWPEITYQDMPLWDLGPAFEGCRIIQLSDLHAGWRVPMEFLQRWSNWAAAQRPDFVVLTGDILQSPFPNACEIASTLLANVRAREGVLAVLGNHEFGASTPHRANSAIGLHAAAALRAAGVRVLRNEQAVFRREKSELNFVGLDDYWSREYDPDAAFRRASTAPTIALSHNPDSFPDLVDRPAQWTLSGHTHGGQVSIPIYGAPIVPVCHKQYVAGRYSLAGRNLYVNRGLGWYLRIRFNARPEITVFTLRRM
jgi:predicted MPP superfamily phosphohydrolase